MNRAWALGLVCAALLVGCSAPAVCETPANDSSVPSLTATPLTSTTTFTRSSQTLPTRVRATLSNLPEVWQDDTNIFGGKATLTITIAYQGTPSGGDGKTQMPRVSASLGLVDTAASVDFGTSEFQAGAASGTLDIFATCQQDDQQDCCKYGARECSIPLAVSLRRLDGEPFPPVDVAATVEASAAVSRCPLDDHQRATLTLAKESP